MPCCLCPSSHDIGDILERRFGLALVEGTIGSMVPVDIVPEVPSLSRHVVAVVGSLSLVPDGLVNGQEIMGVIGSCCQAAKQEGTATF